jgi:hypothetical protein
MIDELKTQKEVTKHSPRFFHRYDEENENLIYYNLQ